MELSLMKAFATPPQSSVLRSDTESTCRYRASMMNDKRLQHDTRWEFP